MKILLIFTFCLVSGAFCGVPKILNAYLGQNITITCKYPGEYESNNKYIDSVDDNNLIKNILNTNTNSQNGRFSITDDKSAKVLSMNISNVTETDEVFYLLGVWNGDGAVRYYTYFAEIQLHIKGPVTCSDVIGYSGGSVIIFSNINWNTHDSKYICKVEENDCSDIIRADTKRSKVQDGRFMLYSNSDNLFLVLIRKLKPQDAGTYRFGLGNQNNSTVNLKVYNSGSCEVPKIMNTYLGQNIAITCNYPGQYEKNYKYFDSVNFDSKINTILDTDTKSQNGRFSISDDKSAKVLSVNISNVTETDEVFYLLGVYNGDGAVRYWSFFAEIQLNIKGPVTCSDVIGYSGGSVIIFSNIKWYTHDSKYICKVEENDCSDIIRADTKRSKVQDGRFLLYSNSDKFFLVLIRKLKPQDAGTYRFGLGNQDNSTVNLKVHHSAFCGVPKILNAYLGQNITITCKYPGEYGRNKKYIDSVDDNNLIKNILNTNTKSQNGRFSITDDRSAKVLSVNISNVTETDEVFYLLGMWNGKGAVRYYSYFAEIQLNIIGSSAFISVCVCMALLLIGGYALMIYKLRCQKTQGPVKCSDVIGYSGGSVIIISNIKWYTHDSKFICKVKENDCSDIIRADTKRSKVQDGRFLLYSNSNDFFLVLIRKLKPQDAGTYRFGLGNQNNSTVNLKVYNSASFGVPKIMSAYLGQNITITCKYPVQFEKNYKYINTVNFDNNINRILDTNTKSQNSRFSITDDKSAKVLSVNISNVTETDEIFYLPGVWNGEGVVGYYSYFAEIQLHITGSFTLIIVCVFAALLLIGGFSCMIYKLRRKRTQGGSVIMISDINWNPNHTKYICKMNQNECKDVIRFTSQSIHVGYKRFLLYRNTAGSFLVLIRKLKPQDAGMYRFGVEDQSNYTVNLKVLNDVSCGVPKIMNAYLGQNISISCNYPGEYEKYNKYIITVDDEVHVKPIIDSQTISENSRFSISDDRSTKVLSVNIINVRETDGVFYLFGVWSKAGTVGYYSYFAEIQLHVTGFFVIISVCICAALLLIAGFVLMIYKLKGKTAQVMLLLKNPIFHGSFMELEHLGS
ncbi:polymeric immunoglobulin receptor-like [Silurus meridionalis]|nr:polymeric immunoglobulin receptor-like [Silurus meridionalis]